MVEAPRASRSATPACARAPDLLRPDQRSPPWNPSRAS